MIIPILNDCLFGNGALREMRFSAKNLSPIISKYHQEFTFHLILLPEFLEFSVRFFSEIQQLLDFAKNSPGIYRTPFLHFEISLILGRTENAVNFW